MAICNECGGSVSENAEFCVHCGQPNPGQSEMARLFDDVRKSVGDMFGPVNRSFSYDSGSDYHNYSGQSAQNNTYELERQAREKREQEKLEKRERLTREEQAWREQKTRNCGVRGDNVVATLSKGTLTISGDGAMKNYDDEDIIRPWHESCDTVFEAVITDGVTSIGNYAFSECSNLTTVTIPDGVTSIGDCAFCGCENLTSVIIPDSVVSIGDDAFSGCTDLTLAAMGNGIVSIGNRAFYGCESLTSIVIPDRVTTIGERAFEDCANLTSVTTPHRVVSFWEEFFDGCTGTSIIISDKEAYYGQLVKKQNKATTEDDYQRIAEQFRRMDGYKDTAELAVKCDNKSRELKEWREEQERSEEYNRIVLRMNEASTENDYQSVAKQFREMNGYKDTADLAERCDNTSRELKKRGEEAERIEKERRYEQARIDGEQERINQRKRLFGNIFTYLLGGAIGGVMFAIAFSVISDIVSTDIGTWFIYGWPVGIGAFIVGAVGAGYGFWSRIKGGCAWGCGGYFVGAIIGGILIAISSMATSVVVGVIVGAVTVKLIKKHRY